MPGDVGDPENAEHLVDEARRAFGGVDVAVACAGTLGLGALGELPIEVWRRTLSVNLDAVFYLLRQALPAMRERGSGSVVVVASIAAFKGFPNHAAYCASKGALVVAGAAGGDRLRPGDPRQRAVPRSRRHAPDLGLGRGVPGARARRSPRSPSGP